MGDYVEHSPIVVALLFCFGVVLSAGARRARAWCICVCDRLVPVGRVCMCLSCFYACTFVRVVCVAIASRSSALVCLRRMLHPPIAISVRCAALACLTLFPPPPSPLPSFPSVCSFPRAPSPLLIHTRANLIQPTLPLSNYAPPTSQQYAQSSFGKISSATGAPWPWQSFCNSPASLVTNGCGWRRCICLTTHTHTHTHNTHTHTHIGAPVS